MQIDFLRTAISTIHIWSHYSHNIHFCPQIFSDKARWPLYKKRISIFPFTWKWSRHLQNQSITDITAPHIETLKTFLLNRKFPSPAIFSAIRIVCHTTFILDSLYSLFLYKQNPNNTKNYSNLIQTYYTLYELITIFLVAIHENPSEIVNASGIKNVLLSLSSPL